MQITVEVEGIDGVIRTFNRLRVAITQEVIDIVNETALNVQRRARENLTRNRSVDTGRLRSSIRPTFYDLGLTAEIGSDVFYARFVEWGTGRAGAASGVKPGDGYTYGPSRGARAKPYLFPAWDAERPEYLKRIEAAIRKATRETEATG